MDQSCPDFTKDDGEFEDNGPLQCGEYQDPYADEEEIPKICVDLTKENPPR